MSLTRRRDRSLAICLALIAGYVDGYGLLALSTYVSFMSGNTTQTGSMLGQQNYSAALPSALAILFFLAGAIFGTCVLLSQFRYAKKFLLLWTASLLAIAYMAMHWHWMGINFTISVLGLAMGSMNTTLSRLGSEPVNVTFVTGTLSKLGGHLALAMLRTPIDNPDGSWDTHLYRAMLLANVWVAFFSGAVISGFVTSCLGAKTLLPPLVILLFLAVIIRDSNASQPTRH